MRVKGPDGKVVEFPDGTPPDTIRVAMARRYGGPATAMTPEFNPISSQISALRGRALETLPTIGGLAGGLVGSFGGPYGAIGGAAAGGALGEGIRESASGIPLSPRDIGTRGAAEGAYQAIGGVIAGRAVPIMRRALGVGNPIAGQVKIGSKLVPDPVPPVLEKNISGTAGGAIKARALRMESGAALKELINQEAAAGRKFMTARVARHVDRLLRSKVLPEEAKEKILKDLTAFYSEKGRNISPLLLQEVKRYYQRQARGIYKATEEGAFTLADQPHGLFAEALARGAREELERIPAVAARNLETRRIKAAQMAVERAVQRPPRAFNVIHPGTYPIAGALASPRVLARTALILNSQWGRQFPRAAAALVQQLRYTDEADATDVSP